MSDTSRLQVLLRSPALRFGSILLAIGLALFDGLWHWSLSSAQTNAKSITSIRASARLSMLQLYDRLIAGDSQPIHDRIASLRSELPADPLDWNYGNVFHKLMTLSGLQALIKEDDLALAKSCLIMSSQIQGSPQLNSFGPNMLLAKSLLDRGEFETVELYLEQCKSFWEMGTTTLDNWIGEVRAHKIPDFSANLNY